MSGMDAPFARSRQDESRRSVLGRLAAVHRYSHGIRRAEDRGRAASQGLSKHNQAHPDYLQMHSRSLAAFGFLLFVLVAVWWVDFLLFSATAEYFAGRVFHNWRWLILPACLISPAVLLVIEIGIGLQRDLARDAAGFGSGVLVWGWTAVGVLLALVVPLAAVATTIAAQPAVSDSEAVAALRMQTAALAILAFAGHMLILFGGRHAHEAKAFVAFKLRQWSLETKVRRYEQRAQTLAEATVSAFEDYYHQREIHNVAFAEAPIDVGPFDAVTRDLINERFGYEFITLTPVKPRRRRPQGESRSEGESTARQKHSRSSPQELAPGVASVPAGRGRRPRKPPEAA
jgi:hypothetical protein